MSSACVSNGVLFRDFMMGRWASIFKPRHGILVHKPVMRIFSDKVLFIREPNDFLSPMSRILVVGQLYYTHSQFSEFLLVKDRQGNHAFMDTKKKLGPVFYITGILSQYINTQHLTFTGHLVSVRYSLYHCLLLIEKSIYI